MFLMKIIFLSSKDCSHHYRQLNSKQNTSSTAVVLLSPITTRGSASAVEAFCENDWTLIQRRFDGSENFYRTWDDYKRGFGDRSKDHWLGNDVIHHLTSQRNYTLRIEMWDTQGKFLWAEYDRFNVASEDDQYRLTVEGFKGNASDAMDYHNGMGFSTRDKDNDKSSTHCAVYYSSGWWYNHCQYVNINGKYNVGLTWFDIDRHEWIQLNRVEMKMRPR